MSLADQLQSLLNSAVTLDRALSDRTTQIDLLTRQVDSLAADNAALQKRIAELDPQAPPPPGGIEWGFVANELDPPAAFAPALARLKADGGSWLRLWHSSFGPISAGTIACVNAAKQAGVRVILCVQPKDTEPAKLGTPDFAAFVSRNAAVLKDITYVEAGNELNLVQYRPDDLGGGGDWHGPYVERWLKPLSAALATVGVRTICTSITDTYHPENYALNYDALLAAGAGDCCDGVALHAYFLPQSLQMLAEIIPHVRETWNKPIYVTECNVLAKGISPAVWQQRFPAYAAVLRAAGVTGVQFYRGFAKPNGKWTRPVLFDATGTPTDAYALFKSVMLAPAVAG